MTTEDKIKEAGEYFGYKELKPFQSNVVKSVCNGQDVFLMSPTGSGKSLTYEMIPFVFERLGKKDTASVIIVSPLVALIEAQCEKLIYIYIYMVHAAVTLDCHSAGWLRL